jgi:MFS superfamily sulfate permease-like transporter
MRSLLNSLSGNSKDLWADLRAGLVVFLVAIPLCLGISLASETPIMSGIIAGAVGGIVIGLIGGSALGVSGPAAGLVTVVAAAVVSLGSYQAFLLTVVLAGVFQLVLGLVRAGVIAYYFPTAVIKGMLAAIGMIILLKQFPHGLGYDKDYLGDEDFFQRDGHTTLSELSYMLDGIVPGAVVITFLCLGLLILWELPRLKAMKFFQYMPGPLVVVIVGICMQSLFAALWPSWALSPEHLVHIDNTDMGSWFSSPDFTAIGNPKIWITALIIAGVASVESLLCAEATDKLDPQKRITPMNRELIAQGFGNIVSGMVGGLPITQVIVRSSANIQAGGRTRRAALFHGLLIVTAIVLIPRVLNLIPYSALAAILALVGYKLARPALFVMMWRKGLAQFIPFIVTVVAILVTDLLVGIGIGMAIGVFTILYVNFKTPYFFRTRVLEDGRREVLLELSESVTFLNKGNILSTLRSLPRNIRVVIDASRTVSIDPDVQEVLDDFIKNAPLQNIDVVYIQHSNEKAEPFETARTVKERLRELNAIQ